MPKIAAPTVAEHRAMIRARLIDAAEAVLRDPAGQLTAGAVTSAAGIARNSIYRYVDSEWLNAVAEALADAHTPGDRVVAWVRVNLEQAAATGHGWLMEAARSQSPNAEMDESVAEAHAGLRNTLADSWADLLRPHPERIPIAAGLTVAILEAGFRQLDRRHPADLVIHLGTTAARALVDALSGDS